MKALTSTQALDSARDSYRDQTLPKLALKIMDATTKLANAAAASLALRLGDIAPDFILPSVDGRSVRLYAELGQGAVVLVIYRGGWCPFCRLHLRGYQKSLADFGAAGAQVIAVSPQLPDHSFVTREKGKLTFTVLCDVGLHTANALGVAYVLPPPLLAIYQGLEVPLEKFNGTEGSNRLPLPATFVIRADRTIAYAHVEADFTRRSEPLEVLRVVDELGNVAT